MPKSNTAALLALLKAAGLDPAALASTVTVASAKASPKAASRTFTAGGPTVTKSGHPAMLYLSSTGTPFKVPTDLVAFIKAN